MCQVGVRDAPGRGTALAPRGKEKSEFAYTTATIWHVCCIATSFPEGGDVCGAVVRQVQAAEEGSLGRVFAAAMERGARRPPGRRNRTGGEGARPARAGRPACSAAERGRSGRRVGARLSAAPPPWRRAR